MYTMLVKGSIVGEYNEVSRTIRSGQIRRKTIARVDWYSLL